MRVLVTGAAGFIGSALVRYLVGNQNYEVLSFDKLTYAGTRASLREVEDRPNHQFLKADICDREAVREALARFQPDWIAHLAAESHVDRSITGAGDFISTNIVGTFSLLEAARDYYSKLPGTRRDTFRFLHVSTDEVFGSLGADGFFSEETPYDPSSPYSASKAASDHLVKAWGRTYDLPVVVSNCSNNYGPYHFPEKLIPLTILNAADGRELPVYGNGENRRDWLFVEDHVRALERILQRGTLEQTYVVGGRNERRNIDVVNRICEVLDRLRPRGAPHARLIRFVADRPGHDARYAIDPTRIETELGWQAQETFETGIERTIRWFLENEWWWAPLRQAYRGDRLGLPEQDKTS